MFAVSAKIVQSLPPGTWKVWPVIAIGQYK
jgi:hypothetical protein